MILVHLNIVTNSGFTHIKNTHTLKIKAILHWLKVSVNLNDDIMMNQK